MHTSIEKKALILASCLLSSCILGGCRNIVYSSPQPKQHFAKPSTAQAKAINLHHMLLHHNFRSKDMHRVITSDFGFLSSDMGAGDGKSDTKAIKSFLGGYRFIPTYQFDKNHSIYVNSLSDVHTHSDILFDTVKPSSDDVLDYYINYKVANHNTLIFHESCSDSFSSTPSNVSKGTKTDNMPSNIKQINYKLHSVSQSTTNPHHVKLTFYPIEDVLKNNKVHMISRADQPYYPFQMTSYGIHHYYHHHKVYSYKPKTKHYGKLPNS